MYADCIRWGMEYRATKKMKQMFCPSCGDVAAGKVNLGNGPRYWCSNDDCDGRWVPDDIDNCIDCGSPVHGTDVICHTCWENPDVDTTD